MTTSVDSSPALADDCAAGYAGIDRAHFADLLDQEFARPLVQRSEHRVPSFYAGNHHVRLAIRSMQMYVPESPAVLTLKADRYNLSVT